MEELPPGDASILSRMFFWLFNVLSMAAMVWCVAYLLRGKMNFKRQVVTAAHREAFVRSLEEAAPHIYGSVGHSGYLQEQMFS